MESASGVRYYGLRYYNPSTGRWLSRDPIGERGGVNLYSICSNAVTNYVDALGLSISSYDIDVSTLKPSPMDMSGFELGLAVPSVDPQYGIDTEKVKTEDCRTGYGKKLTLKGGLKVNLYHKRGIDPSVVKGADDWTVNDHERRHAYISQNAWNHGCPVKG